MNKEIKERLEDSLNYEFQLSFSERKQLLDYITNLQIIEQQYGAILNENAELENKITNLQEELVEQKRIEKESLDKILDLEDTIVDKKECIYALDTSLTNLQEAKDKLQNDYQEAVDKTTELQEELKSANESITWWSNRFNAVSEANKDHQRINGELRKQLKQTEELAMEYKTRNEKVKNYLSNFIEKWENNEDTQIWILNFIELSNILKGEK